MLWFLQMIWRNATVRLQDYVTELHKFASVMSYDRGQSNKTVSDPAVHYELKNDTLAITIAINVVCIGWLLENRYLVAGLKFGWGILLAGWTKFWLMEGLPTGDSPLPPFHPVGRALTNMGNH